MSSGQNDDARPSDWTPERQAEAERLDRELRQAARRLRRAQSADAAALGQARAHVRDALAIVKARMQDGDYSPNFIDECDEVAAVLHDAFAIARIIFDREGTTLGDDHRDRFLRDTDALLRAIAATARDRERFAAEAAAMEREDRPPNDRS